MKKSEIKTLLAEKLKAEGTGFTKKDISIKDIKDGFVITIADYTHCPIKVTFYDGEWWAYDGFEEEYFSIDSDLKYAILTIGYHIASRF